MITRLPNSSGSKPSNHFKNFILKIVFNLLVSLLQSCTNEHTTKLARNDGLRGEFSVEALKNMKPADKDQEPSSATWFDLKEQEVCIKNKKKKELLYLRCDLHNPILFI